MKKLLTLSALAFLVGCGGSNSSSSSSNVIPSLAGNWTFNATSSKFGTQSTASGTVARNGTSLSASLSIMGSPCASSGALTGTLNGDSITMTLNENGQAVTFTGTVASDGNSASGSYTAAAGGCTNGDSGTWAGTRTTGSNSGAASPTVTLSPTSLTFGMQNTSTNSAAQSVTLSNTGTASLTITAISISGDFGESNNCGTSLSAGANCTVQVTFSPTTTGNRTGTVTIQDNSANSPQTVSLSGDGSQVVTATVTGKSGSQTPTPDSGDCALKTTEWGIAQC